MAIAAYWGKSVGFTDYYNSVLVEKPDGSARVVGKKTFEELYYRLDSFTAAFKEDCIEYVRDDPGANLLNQPEWFIDAVEDGLIYETCGMVCFYEEDGEIAMSPGSVILKNFKGQLKYMEFDDFTKYFDVEECDY